MSTCISRAGEFGSHTLDESFVCTVCFALDEDAMTAELNRLRVAVVEAAVTEARTMFDELHAELRAELAAKDAEIARLTDVLTHIIDQSTEARAALVAPTLPADATGDVR